MGKCTLTFEQIEILTKKSDSDHSDNDWLIVNWFVGDGVVRTDTIPLVNQNGSRIINSGDHLQPVSLEVPCADTDLVTAAFLVMNLGAYDFNEQIEAAGKIASKYAEEAAKIYLAAAKFVIENLGEFVANPAVPVTVFAKLLAAHWDEFAPAIKDSVGAFVEDVLVPAIEEIVEDILVLLDRPNCNGPVFHDVVVFRNPTWPEPPQMTWKLYTADTKLGCGDPARTSVHYSIDRVLDFVPQFPNTAPSTWEFIPSENESPTNWVHDWVSDNKGFPKAVNVSIAPSLKASGLFAITIKELIDPRFQIAFSLVADPKSPTSKLFLLPFKENVKGAIQPWSTHPGSAATLQVFGAKSLHTTAHSATSARRSANVAPPEPYLALSWKRPFTPGTPVRFARATFGEPFVPGGGFEESTFLQTADGFRLPEYDITLAFYNVVSDGTLVARALRYLRGASGAYTRADWMLMLLTNNL
jgi:hypothetical protein